MAYGYHTEIYIAATHGLFTANDTEKLARYPVRKIIVTDSLPAPPTDTPLEVVSLGSTIAKEIMAVSAKPTS